MQTPPPYPETSPFLSSPSLPVGKEIKTSWNMLNMLIAFIITVVILIDIWYAWSLFSNLDDESIHYRTLLLETPHPTEHTGHEVRNKISNSLWWLFIAQIFILLIIIIYTLGFGIRTASSFFGEVIAFVMGLYAVVLVSFIGVHSVICAYRWLVSDVYHLYGGENHAFETVRSELGRWGNVHLGTDPFMVYLIGLITPATFLIIGGTVMIRTKISKRCQS